MEEKRRRRRATDREEADKRLEMEYKYTIERKRNGQAFTSCNGSRKFLRVMNNFQREKEGGVWRLKRERETGET